MFDHVAKNTLVPLLLRLGLAVIFLFHGGEKLFKDGNALGADWAKPQKEGQQTMPRLMQLAVAWGEFLGGAALAIGFLSRLAALGIAVIMAGAIAMVHGEHGFAAPKGFEYNFALIVMCAAVMLLGSGTLSVDRFLRWRRRTAAHSG